MYPTYRAGPHRAGLCRPPSGHQSRAYRPLSRISHRRVAAFSVVSGYGAGGEGATLFVENIFDARYRHVDELRRMGADIQLAGRAAMVSGVGRLHGAAVRSTDLRGGAALVVAGLGAEGTTQVSELRHIRRGYQDLDRNFRALGADIREVP